VSLETARGTHEVLNQSVPFEDVDLFGLDLALQEARSARALDGPPSACAKRA
jgi:hypothetical protein